MDGWHALAAAVEASLLIVLVLLRYDTLRDRRGTTLAQATSSRREVAVIVPVGLVRCCWCRCGSGLILVAVPAIAVGVMALAS